MTLNHADDSQNGVMNNKISIGVDLFVMIFVIMLSSLSLCLSIYATIDVYDANRKLALADYWLNRNEAFLEQLSAQGIKVPCDIVPHNKECKR